MKKSLATLAVLLLVLLALVNLCRGEGPAPNPASGPEAQPHGSGQLAEGPRADPADPPIERVEASLPASGAATESFTLLDADGTPRAGVPYWADEKPFRMHPGTAPEGAPRTDGAGRFDPGLLGDGDWLWFDIDEGLSLAVARDRLRETRDVRIPKRKQVTVEIRALPAGESWKIAVYPGWLDDDLDEQHGARHVQELPGAGVWIARRLVPRLGESGPARARFELVEGLHAAFYCQSLGYEIEPEIQELVSPDLVVAHAGRHRSLFEFAVIEPDGITASAMGGRVMLSTTSNDWSLKQDFTDGRGSIAWSGEEHAGIWLSFVLRDGEVFAFPLSDDRIRDGQLLRLVRGSGRPAIRVLDIPAAVAEWPDPKTLVEVNGGLRRVSGFSWFVPVEKPLIVGAWVDHGRLVIQTSDSSVSIGRVVFVSPDGQMAQDRGSELAPMRHVAMQPIEPRALIERLARPAGARYLMVHREIALPGIEGPAEGWIRVAVLRFHVRDGLGWRFSRTGTIDVHEALPDRIETQAPEGARSRLRVRVRGNPDWIVLPHVPLR